MTVTVTVKQTYRTVPLEITAESSEVSTVDFGLMLEQLRRVVDGWVVIQEKRQKRAWRKMVKPSPLHMMMLAKLLHQQK